jgi:hypothetical protein
LKCSSFDKTNKSFVPIKIIFQMWTAGKTNPLRISTSGMEAMHQRIHRRALHPAAIAGGAAGTAIDQAERRLQRAWQQPDGSLPLSGDKIHGSLARALDSLPLIGRRFRVTAVIGEGSFAQVKDANS